MALSGVARIPETSSYDSSRIRRHLIRASRMERFSRTHREAHDAGQPVGHLQPVDQSSRERREYPFWMLAGHRADQMHRTGPLRERLEVRSPRIVALRSLDRLSGDASARERTRLSPPANASLTSASAVSKSRSAASQPRLTILDPPYGHRSREAANKSQTRMSSPSIAAAWRHARAL